MATLLLYQSKHGTTRKIAHLIADAWTHDTIQIVDLAQEKVPNLKQFDTVLVGGSIHMGRIQRKVGQFCEALIEQLLTKKVGLFMCFMDFDKGMEEFKENFPYALREHATAHGLFGGEFIFEKMNATDKFIAPNINEYSSSVSKLNLKAIEEFIEKMEKVEVDHFRYYDER